MRPFADIIDFTESPEGLNLCLFPAQKFILKMAYGLALDARENTIRAGSWKKADSLLVSEEEYAWFLREDGRCTIEEGAPAVPHPWTDVYLSLGRRSGKNTLASVIAAWGLHGLLSKECPQTYYGMSKNTTIQILVVAIDRDQAKCLRRIFFRLIEKNPLFTERISNSTQSSIMFSAKAGRDREGTPRASIKVNFIPEMPRRIRGSANLLVIMDEAAHMRNAADVYLAAEPSTRCFSPKNPEDVRKMIGPCEGKVVMISSPLEGSWFNMMFDFGLGPTNPMKALSIQAPTWELNPTIPESLFDEQEGASDCFYQEFGAMGEHFYKTWRTLQDARATLTKYLAPRLVSEALRDLSGRLAESSARAPRFR